MAGGISIHVYDVSRGVPASGLRVEVRSPEGKVLVDQQTAATGTLECATPLTGTYEAIFHIGDWYRAQGVAGIAADALGDPARGEPRDGDRDDRRQQRHEEALAQQQQEGERRADGDGEPDVVVGRLAGLRAQPVRVHGREGEQRPGQHRA